MDSYLAELDDLLDKIRKHPGMYLMYQHSGNPAFFSLVDYLNGMNRQSGFLSGLEEWLIPRVGYGDNLTWAGLMMLLIFPESESPCDFIRSDEDAAEIAFRRTLELLREFLGVKYSRNGPTKIHVEYHAWLKKQAWYDETSPQWIPEM